VEQSKEGVIFYNYDDSVHAISESEFASVYGSVDAWLTWRKKPGNDWARTKTDKHANVAGWLCRSSADTNLPNFTFIMHPMSFPADTAPEDVAERLIGCLSPYAYDKTPWATLRKDLVRRLNADQHTNTTAERIAYEHGELAKIVPKYTKPLFQRCNVQQGEMSHEQDTVRKIYSQVYHLAMKATNPKKHGGVELINREMRVDYNEPHAFRPEKKGYSTWAMVVDDDKTREPYRFVDNKPVYHPKPYPLAIQTNDLSDGDLFRYQFTNFRYQLPTLTASGEVTDDPLKLYDDAPQMLAMLYCGSPLQGTSLTEAQQINLLIPEPVKAAAAAARTGDERLVAHLDFEFQRDVAMTKLNPDRELGGEDMGMWE